MTFFEDVDDQLSTVQYEQFSGHKNRISGDRLLLRENLQSTYRRGSYIDCQQVDVEAYR